MTKKDFNAGAAIRFVQKGRLKEAQKMYEIADFGRLGYIVVSEEGYEKGPIEDTMSKAVYVVPKNKPHSPSCAMEFMVKFLPKSAAVVAATLDGEHVHFKCCDKVDISKLETNTQKMDRLEREVRELRAFGKKYCKHLPNCCSTTKGCHCEMSHEMKRLGVR
jgi:hypothetical protein